MERPIAYDKLAREDRFVRMRARRVGELRAEQGLPPMPDLSSTESIRERAGETWDRGISRAGVMRQMGAILTQPDRSRALRSLRVPSLVIHGTHDKMVHVSGGRATSQAIPGCELLLVPGMGHDVPRELHATFADAIRRVADRVETKR